MLVAMIAELPAQSIAAFRAYEDAVLPLLPEHGGRLERRVRGAEGCFEIHLVSFESRAGFDAFATDPRRAEARRELEGLELETRLVEVEDVD